MKDIAQDRSLEVSEMLVETITDLEVIRENRQIKIRNKSRSCSRGNEKHIMSICTHLDVLWKVCFFAAEGRCQQRCPEQSRLPSANSKGLVSFFIFFFLPVWPWSSWCRFCCCTVLLLISLCFIFLFSVVRGFLFQQHCLKHTEKCSISNKAVCEFCVWRRMQAFWRYVIWWLISLFSTK